MTATARQAIGRDDLLRRAVDLIPVIAERALAAEQRRQIPEETVKDLISSGLLRIANPTRYGGYGLDYDTVIEVGAVLGRGCGSTAWCYTVWSSHNWVLGLYPERAQDEYFGSSPDVLSSSGFNPTGKAEKTSGGYLLSGRWDFSSGCDAGSWAVLAAFTPEHGPGLFLVPRRDYRIDDTWFVSGLRGTGSKDIVIEQPVLVPEHRFLSYHDMGTAQTPGRAIHQRPSYQLPAFCLFPFNLAAPLVGIAQGAVDGFEQRMRTRLSAVGGQKMHDRVNIQARLAEASVEVDCARLLMRHDLDEMLSRAARGEMPTLEARLRYRRDHAYMAKLSVQAVNRLFEVSGGHALFDASPIQRAHRDVHAGSHQVALMWDTYAEQYGRVRLGLEPTDVFV